MHPIDKDFLRSNFAGSAFVWKDSKDNPAISIFGLPLLAADAMLLPFRALLGRRDSWSDDLKELERLRAEQGLPGSQKYADYLAGKSSHHNKPSQVRKESVMYPSWCTPHPDFIKKPWNMESGTQLVDDEVYLPARPPPSAYSYHSGPHQSENDRTPPPPSEYSYHSGLRQSENNQRPRPRGGYAYNTGHPKHGTHQKPPSASTYFHRSGTGSQPVPSHTQHAPAYGYVPLHGRTASLQGNDEAVLSSEPSPSADRLTPSQPIAKSQHSDRSSRYTGKQSRHSSRPSRKSVGTSIRSSPEGSDSRGTYVSKASEPVPSRTPDVPMNHYVPSHTQTASLQGSGDAASRSGSSPSADRHTPPQSIAKSQHSDRSSRHTGSSLRLSSHSSRTSGGTGTRSSQGRSQSRGSYVFKASEQTWAPPPSSIHTQATYEPSEDTWAPRTPSTGTKATHGPSERTWAPPPSSIHTKATYGPTGQGSTICPSESLTNPLGPAREHLPDNPPSACTPDRASKSGSSSRRSKANGAERGDHGRSRKPGCSRDSRRTHPRASEVSHQDSVGSASTIDTGGMASTANLASEARERVAAERANLQGNIRRSQQ